MAIRFSFQFERSLQATAYLLKKAGCQPITYIHLIKMLYIADREYLAENGYTLTGDKAVAMQHGPVLSHVFDLFRERDSQTDKWIRYIHTSRNHQVRLVNDPGEGELSRLAMQKLDSVFERFGNLNPFDVVRLTHEFPEWQEVYREGTSTPIDWQDVLRVQGRSEMVDIAKKQVALQHHAEKMEEMLHAAR